MSHPGAPPPRATPLPPAAKEALDAMAQQLTENFFQARMRRGDLQPDPTAIAFLGICYGIEGTLLDPRWAEALIRGMFGSDVVLAAQARGAANRFMDAYRTAYPQEDTPRGTIIIRSRRQVDGSFDATGIGEPPADDSGSSEQVQEGADRAGA